MAVTLYNSINYSDLFISVAKDQFKFAYKFNSTDLYIKNVFDSAIFEIIDETRPNSAIAKILIGGEWMNVVEVYVLVGSTWKLTLPKPDIVVEGEWRRTKPFPIIYHDG